MYKPEHERKLLGQEYVIPKIWCSRLLGIKKREQIEMLERQRFVREMLGQGLKIPVCRSRTRWGKASVIRFRRGGEEWSLPKEPLRNGTKTRGMIDPRRLTWERGCWGKGQCIQKSDLYRLKWYTSKRPSRHLVWTRSIIEGSGVHTKLTGWEAIKYKGPKIDELMPGGRTRGLVAKIPTSLEEM